MVQKQNVIVFFFFSSLPFFVRSQHVKQIIKIFQNQRIGDISEIAYYLIKDKTGLLDLISFQEQIITQQDRVNLIKALLETIGISQPIVAEITKEMAKEEASGNAEAVLTGQDSTTSLPVSTATP